MLSDAWAGGKQSDCGIFRHPFEEGKMNRAFLRVIPVGLFLAGVLLLVSPPLRAQGDGAATYKAKCAVCHGADGSGDTAMGKSMKLRDLRSEDVQKQTDAQLIEITANGKAKMPAYKGKLTDDQIKQVVAAIRDMAKKK
jgi:cytochrome c6